MKRQRNVIGTTSTNTMKRPKIEGATMTAATTTTTTTVSMTKKKAKREVEKEKEEVVKVEEDQERSEGRELGLAENVMGLEEWCPWLGDAADIEQMSWGSAWLPCWDVEFMCQSYSVFFGDVVWDDDIWNLRAIKEVPKP